VAVTGEPRTTWAGRHQPCAKVNTAITSVTVPTNILAVSIPVPHFARSLIAHQNRRQPNRADEPAFTTIFLGFRSSEVVPNEVQAAEKAGAVI
jgi:hypothetical protein